MDQNVGIEQLFGNIWKKYPVSDPNYKYIPSEFVELKRGVEE
jgi:hypothetical protein